MMKKDEFSAIEAHMLDHTNDSAHDRHHIDRVLYAALHIAAQEKAPVDMDVLIAACLLHDIGRPQQAIDPRICHAQAGADMAFDFLVSLGWPVDKANSVKQAISSHRYRGNNPPQSIEAKILFDSDKLDVCGPLGIARTLIYAGQAAEGMYRLDSEGQIITDSAGEETVGFFEEFHHKLIKVYDAFYTQEAARMARALRPAALDFYRALYSQIDSANRLGALQLQKLLN